MRRLITLLMLALSIPAMADTLPPKSSPPDCGSANIPWKLVYTRQPRAADQIANWQHVNDIVRVWQQSEADVVLDEGGKISVIHDCTGSPQVCTAQEAKVSPDGKRIIYAVSNGKALDISVWANGKDTELRDFDTTTAELWLYDVPTGTKRKLSSGHIDRMPDFCGNDCIVFASDRSGTYAPRSTLARNFYPRKAFHIHRARITDTGLADIVDITPAEHFAMSPKVLTSGEVAYSGFEGVAPREFGSTPQNHWWIKSVDINGNAPRSLLGGHGSGTIENLSLIKDWVDPLRRGEGSTQLRGLRPVAELSPGFLAVSNYYRGNSLGAMGKVIGWQHSTAEGALYEKNIPAMNKFSAASVPGSGRYVPSTIINMTPYGQDQDNLPLYGQNGKATGRAGYAAPWPDSWGFGKEAWLYTHARGWCYEWATPDMNTTAAMGGEPTCKKEIRLAFGKQVKNPFDPAQSVTIACGSLDLQCWDQQPVAPYKDLYGIDAPQIAPIVKPENCELHVVNARAGELFPIPGKADTASRIAFQANAVDNYPALADSFGVEYFEPWRVLPTKEGLNMTGSAKAKILVDGSVRLQVDCNRPFQHFGYDAQGNRIASGLSPISTRGTLTCHGCHFGHAEETKAGDAVEKFKMTEAAKQ